MLHPCGYYNITYFSDDREKMPTLCIEGPWKMN